MTSTLAPRLEEPSRAAHGGARAELWVAHAGRVPYAEGVAVQERLREARQAGAVPDALLLLEHPPVYTKGRRTEAGDLPMGEDWYRSQAIEVAECDRGGRVTYHGPGQLVGYPIVATSDVVEYVRTLERAVIAALADEGLEAEVREGLTGVWVGERKIGSIGVHVQKGVTTHGFAVNVDCDLQPFEWVVPCGIQGVRMTSICRETARAGGMRCFGRRVAWRVAHELGRRQRIVSLDRLLERSGNAPRGDKAAVAPRAVPA
jgi:lipoate-protein ligase B